jgi:hypothetical protein
MAVATGALLPLSGHFLGSAITSLRLRNVANDPRRVHAGTPFVDELIAKEPRLLYPGPLRLEGSPGNLVYRSPEAQILFHADEQDLKDYLTSICLSNKNYPRNHTILELRQIFGAQNNLKKSWRTWSLGGGLLGIILGAYMYYKGNHIGPKIALGSLMGAILTQIGIYPFPGKVRQTLFAAMAPATSISQNQSNGRVMHVYDTEGTHRAHHIDANNSFMFGDKTITLESASGISAQASSSNPYGF